MEEDQAVEHQLYLSMGQRLFDATAAFEHAMLKPLFLLNGGAAVVFLAFIGQVWPQLVSTDQLDPNVLSGLTTPLAIWSAGLAFGAIAVFAGYYSQQSFSEQFGGERREEKFRREGNDTLASTHAKTAKFWGTIGTWTRRVGYLFILASLAAFVVGAREAIEAIVQPIG